VTEWVQDAAAIGSVVAAVCFLAHTWRSRARTPGCDGCGRRSSPGQTELGPRVRIVDPGSDRVHLRVVSR
jgi:hypothetical protein